MLAHGGLYGGDTGPIQRQEAGGLWAMPGPATGSGFSEGECWDTPGHLPHWDGVLLWAERLLLPEPGTQEAVLSTKSSWGTLPPQATPALQGGGVLEEGLASHTAQTRPAPALAGTALGGPGGGLSAQQGAVARATPLEFQGPHPTHPTM